MDYKNIYEIFELEKEDMFLVNAAISKMLNEDINIEKTMEKSYFDTLIENKSYQNIWVLLLKIYIIGMKSKGQDIEKEIIENKKYGFDNMIDLAKYILK